MSDPTRRAVRTFLQGFVGVLVLVAVPTLSEMVEAAAGGRAIELDGGIWQGIGVAAIAGGVIAVISWAQNELEERSGTAILPK